MNDSTTAPTEPTAPPLKINQVFEYEPDNSHARSGYAIVTEFGDGLVLRDTYWSSDRPVLRATEVATAHFAFDLDEYREVKDYEWEEYAKADQQGYRTQHWIYLARNDAQPDLDTKIQKAWQELEKARRTVEAAGSHLVWTARQHERLCVEREARRAGAST